jgi:N12 class adenine-specific DNA methylase
MPPRRQVVPDPSQLDLFAPIQKHYDHNDPIRTDGREPLARVPPEDGRGARSEGNAASDAVGSGGTDRRGSGPDSPPIDSAGTDPAAGARHGLGNGAGAIPLPAARILPPVRDPDPVRNQNNYRITDADKVGAGSLKQKCRDNLAAIELLKHLEAETRPATDEEKRTLVRYSGWGGLPQVFDPQNREWAVEGERLEKLLTPVELDSARATTLNAHYTAPVVIRGMYAALHRFGFEHGRILEPACGLGHFIGLMPEAMHARSQITGIEIDSTTTRLAKMLYPDADIRHQPFEEARLADGFYDVAISNIPFGDYKPYDPRFKKWNFIIHDYFFAATLEKVRPGGLVLFVTSKGTFDKLDGALREYVSQQADLLGAIRLPNDAFKRNANTEVTTDIVMLRKRMPGELPQGPAWKQLTEITNSTGEALSINEYFAERPQMMLGEMRLEGRMYGRSEAALIGNGRDLGEPLHAAIGLLPAGVFHRQRIQVAAPTVEQTFPAPDSVKPNAYALVNGAIAIRVGEEMRVLGELNQNTAAKIRGLIRVRDAVRLCLRSQLEGHEDEAVVSAREQLNQAYDRFVQSHGPISARSNTAAFRADPDLPLLLSLENYDEETKRATKAAIFRERTIQHNRPVSSVADAREALLVTLNERGWVDLDHLSGLLQRAPAEFLPELKGTIFLNPLTSRWETEDEYLSGNVRAKLSAAEASALVDPQFQANVEVLKGVQPADLNATEIDARLGSAWIPAEDIRKFAEEMLGETGISASYAPTIGTWIVRGGFSAKASVGNTAEFGTDRRNALDLLEDALNLRTPTVYDYDPEKQREVINPAATEGARDKQEKIKARFKDWIWSDDDRRERLTRKYNDEFNHTRLRTFNGDHLTLPGASPAIVLRPHQKASVWRILQTPNTLLAHVVGAGKTYTMVAAAMELRRLGLARKPLFAVPNHMLGQFSGELLTLYPGANILVASKDDFEKQKRKTLLSRIATGNWDAVIVTHSGFEKIPIARATQEEFFREQLRELELAITEQRKHDNSRIVKELERAKKKLETRLKELTGAEKKDDTLTFEELGVDRVFVDEAHYFKNLFYVSKMTRIAGLPATASQRAFDMFLKTRHIQRVNGGGGITFATGTPIANSVAEMFTMQKYLQMTALKAQRIDHFDSWAATFGEPVTAMELSPDGSGYRINTRFARFINVPELMQQFRQVADIQTQTMLKLPVPVLRHGKPLTVSAPCSADLKEIVQSLVERAEALRTGQVDPRDDNMLLVTTDGRKAALDLRLYNPGLPDHPYSKVNKAVGEVERIWRETSERRCSQLVFCDLSTPTQGKGFSVYEDMRDKLVARGIPAAEIAFIQDYDSDNAKVELFRDVRAGKVRVLFGSTQKMGAGTNVQERLVALHHLDAPWRPADVEQREGRILRQGNTNPEIQIHRYVTEESFDAYMWQTLETKARFIAQVMTGENSLRRIEDVDGAALTYAEVKAIASGNPMVIEKAGIDAEVARLTRLRSQHAQTQYNLRYQCRHHTEEVPRLQKRLEAVQRDMAARHDTSGDKFIVELEGQAIRDRGIAGELILRRAERMNGTRAQKHIGSFAGFKLSVADNYLRGVEVLLEGATAHVAKVANTALGTIRSLEYTIQNLDETAACLTENIKSSQKRLAGMQEQVGQPFEHVDKLATLLKRQQEITDALDLHKNQASNQLDAQASETPDEILQENQSSSQKPEQRNGHEIAPAGESMIVNPSRQKQHVVRV